VSEEAAVDFIEGWQSTATTDTVCENAIELVTRPTTPPIDVRPYKEPMECTASPLEYAFHLLNGVRGRTVVDLGCGTGFNSVVLAKLGAQVISIDSSDANLEATERQARLHGVANRVAIVQSRGWRVPARDTVADRVFCNSILQHPDPISIARQIRRILKPGGRAVFHDSARTGLAPGFSGTARTKDFVRTLSRAVGIPDRVREFWLLTSLLHGVGIRASSSLGQASQRFDAALFRRLPSLRLFASTIVWGARKES